MTIAIHNATVRHTAAGKAVIVRGFTQGHTDAKPKNSSLNKPVTAAKVTEIATRPDLMQFKRIENVDGTNGHDTIKGKWNDLYAGVITVWQPVDPKAYGLKRGEKYIVVNGHHRLAHAAGFGVKTLRVQVLYEGKGPDKETSNFTPLAARRIGAEINIVDGKGSIYDQVKFLRDQRAVVGKDGSLERAREIGISGGSAAAIAFGAKDSLAAAFFAERITPQQAEVIATASSDEDLQRVGLKEAIKGKHGPALYHYIMAVKAMRKDKSASDQWDLFGNSDDTIIQAEKMAEAAARIQRGIKEQILSAAGAARRPDQARELGVNVSDASGTLKELVRLKLERDKWDKWYLYPTLVAQAKGVPMRKSFDFPMYLIKSHVKQHTRVNRGGSVSIVKEHNDIRAKHFPLPAFTADNKLTDAEREKPRHTLEELKGWFDKYAPVHNKMVQLTKQGYSERQKGTKGQLSTEGYNKLHADHIEIQKLVSYARDHANHHYDQWFDWPKDELEKSHIKQHTRTTKSGKVAIVHDYDDRRNKMAAESRKADIPTQLQDLPPALREKCRRAAPGQGHEITLLKIEAAYLLKKGVFGLISAGRNPASPLDRSLSDKDIEQRYGDLKKDLKAKGLKWVDVDGFYEGEEKSMWVLNPDIHKEELVELGAKFNQDSVIFADHGHNEMLFTTGPHKGERHEGNGFQEVPDADDYFTEVKTPKGKMKFCLGFNFDKFVKSLKMGLYILRDYRGLQ